MQTINLSYDKKYDILYARYPFNGHSYGHEDDNGIITYYNIQTDHITGMAIHSFCKRFNTGKLNLRSLPVPLDSVISNIQSLIKQ